MTATASDNPAAQAAAEVERERTQQVQEMVRDAVEAAKARKAEIDAQMADAKKRLPDAVKCIAERVMNDGNR